MKTFKMTKEDINSALEENSMYLKIPLTEVEIMEDGDTFSVKVVDDKSNIYQTIIFSDVLISYDDLSDEIEEMFY